MCFETACLVVLNCSAIALGVNTFVATSTKIGREIYYQLKINKMKEVDQWLEQFKAIWESRFSQLDQVLMNLKSKENEI